MPLAYTAARAAALTVEDFFRRHDAAATHPHVGRAPLPPTDVIARVADAAFWASLGKEEGRSPRISLACVTADRAGQPLRFERSLPLAPDALARLSPAVERPGIHLGVQEEDGELRVWGATRVLPDLCLVFEVVEPGLVVIKYRRGPDFGKFGNIAVLRGKQIQEVDELSASLPDCPALLAALLGFESPASWIDSRNELVQLAISMRGHGRGGLLLVVPNESSSWKESIIQPVLYSISPAFTRLAQLLREPSDRRETAKSKEQTRSLVDGIAGLTAVDGAAVITHEYELLAFGAKIGRREGSPPVERVAVTEPVVGNVPVVVPPTQLGGTRHLSAAQFVHDQRDALALVASQDGGFTVLAWSPCESLVHAHRIEALLY